MKGKEKKPRTCQKNRQRHQVRASAQHLIVSVLVSQTPNPPLQTVTSSSETAGPADAAVVVQIGIVRGLDFGVLAVIASDGGRVASVEEALVFLPLVVLLERGGVLHFDAAVVVDSVSAQGAVEAESVALAFEVFGVVVLRCDVR